MIEETKLDLPDAFLKRWIRVTNENPISVEQVETEYPAFRNNLTLHCKKAMLFGQKCQYTISIIKKHNSNHYIYSIITSRMLTKYFRSELFKLDGSDTG